MTLVEGSSRFALTAALMSARPGGPDDVAALLADLVGRPQWHADALCAEYPSSWFFPERGESTAPAKAICGRCLVAEECRQWAVSQGGGLAGIWGGTSAGERRRLRESGAQRHRAA